MNDALQHALGEVRQSIEVGKSISRLVIDVDIGAAEYLLSLADAAHDAENAEPTDEFKEIEDLNAEVDALNTTIVDRDGAILELQKQIEANTEASQTLLDDLTKERDEVIDLHAAAAEADKGKGKKKT